jgi:hypothetical protein
MLTKPKQKRKLQKSKSLGGNALLEREGVSFACWNHPNRLHINTIHTPNTKHINPTKHHNTNQTTKKPK